MKTNPREGLRKQHLEESRWNPYHQRNGMFSQPGNLAMGDDTYCEEEKRHVSPHVQKQITANKNMSTNFREKTKPFQVPHYELNDYDDTKINRDKEKAVNMYKFHGKPFMAGGRSHSLDSDIKYAVQKRVGQGELMVTGGFKGRGGGKNFTTGNGRVGSTLMTTFGRYPEHIPEPYERDEDIRRAEREKQKSKILYNQAFLNKSSGDHDFDRLNEQKDASPASAHRGYRDHRRVNTVAHVSHTRPWLCTSPKTRTMATKKMGIGAFPDHQPEMQNQEPRVIKTSPKPWYHTHNYKSRPMPKITATAGARNEYGNFKQMDRYLVEVSKSFNSYTFYITLQDEFDGDLLVTPEPSKLYFTVDKTTCLEIPTVHPITKIEELSTYFQNGILTVKLPGELDWTHPESQINSSFWEYKTIFCKTCGAALSEPLGTTFDVPLMDIEELNEIWTCHCSLRVEAEIIFKPLEAYIRGFYVHVIRSSLPGVEEGENAVLCKACGAAVGPPTMATTYTLYQSRISNSTGVIFSAGELIYNALFNTLEFNTDKDVTLTPLDSSELSLHIKLMHWQVLVSIDGTYREAMKVLYKRVDVKEPQVRFPENDIRYMEEQLNQINEYLPSSSNKIGEYKISYLISK